MLTYFLSPILMSLDSRTGGNADDDTSCCSIVEGSVVTLPGDFTDGSVSMLSISMSVVLNRKRVECDFQNYPTKLRFLHNTCKNRCCSFNVQLKMKTLLFRGHFYTAKILMLPHVVQKLLGSHSRQSYRWQWHPLSIR